MAHTDERVEFDLLESEYGQAWSHLRHVETQRMQYLGFFFTVSLGTGALAGQAVAQANPASDAHLLAYIGFLAVYFVVTVFVWTSVRRNGRVLVHYDRTLRELRAAREELARARPEHRGILTVRLPFVPGLRGVGLQRSSEAIMAGFAVAEVALQIAVVVFAIVHSARVLVPVLTGVVALASLVTVGLLLLPERTRAAPGVSGP